MLFVNEMGLAKYTAMLQEMKAKVPVDGPWNYEPDRVLFNHAGFACLVQRAPLLCLCGYVGIPEGHALFGKNYDKVSYENPSHAGLTYAQQSGGLVGQSGEELVWWLGFDCCHGMDFVPGFLIHAPDYYTPTFMKATYRTYEYVRGVTEELAEWARSVH